MSHMSQLKRYLSVVLGMIVASLIVGRANAQTLPAGNAPRPLEALGMTYEKFASYLGSCQKECRQHQKDAKLGYRTSFDLPPYSFTVESGKVVEVMITTDSFEDFINEGKEKWGQPTKLEYQVLQNPDGRESRNGTARWQLPGGVLVDARQTRIPGKVLGVTKLHLDGKTIYLTQKDPPSEGALVVITNPSAQRAEKPKPVPVL
jgi:hypothetical protein